MSYMSFVAGSELSGGIKYAVGEMSGRGNVRHSLILLLLTTEWRPIIHRHLHCHAHNITAELAVTLSRRCSCLDVGE